MFNKESCKVCGACVSGCPFVEIPRKCAKDEVALLIQGKGSENLIDSCAGCAYCDVICPTQSNPSHLRKEVRQNNIRRTGAIGLLLISDEVPVNIMSIGLEFEREEKLRRLDLYSKTVSSKKVFYLGCSLSYIYADLANTKLLSDLPMIGGMKFCCGGFVRSQFGEEEAAIHGTRLLKELKEIGVESMVTLCPECDYMIGDYYPSIIPEFDIKSTNIVAYLLEQHRSGKIEFTNTIDQRVTFHDACAWRKMDPEFHENPRRLLEVMGAEVVEMKHNRKKSMCCGAPASARDRQLAAEVAERRVAEAKESGAETIVIGCTGCFSLSKKAAEQGMGIYHITELVQMAIGEEPLHRIEEIRSQISKNLMKRISEDPDILRQRYVIKQGEIISL